MFLHKFSSSFIALFKGYKKTIAQGLAIMTRRDGYVLTSHGCKHMQAYYAVKAVYVVKIVIALYTAYLPL